MANQYSADVPKGFNVPKQVRLDSITSIQNENTLKNLGIGNNLAFKYYEGLKVYCKDEKTEYVWREVVGLETGLLNTPFTYPTYPPVDGVDYSEKSFNFFLAQNSNIQPSDGSETKVTAGNNVSVTGAGTIASPYIVNSTDTNTIADGSETKINSGTNTTITGVGTIVAPYVINSPFQNLQNTIDTGGHAEVDDGNSVFQALVGTINDRRFVASIDNGVIGSRIDIKSDYVLLSSYNAGISGEVRIDNGVTKLSQYNAGSSTNTIFNTPTVNTNINFPAKTIAGTYIIATLDDIPSLNLQKTITYPTDFTGTNYTITNADNNYTIIVNNATTACTITVPSGLMSKIGVGFIQKGTADVTFVASGTTIQNPIGLKSKGQYYQTFIEQELATNVIYLLGNTKV